METVIKKVIFIDDEENILHSIRRMFHKSDLETYFTTEPEELFKLIRENKFAVVVSDQRMPKIEGVEVLRKVKEISPDSIRIMLTGYADIKSAMRAVNDGNVFRFLAKPWNEDDLKISIQSAVEQYNLVLEHRSLSELTRKQNIELTMLNEDLEKRVDERTAEVSKLNEDLKSSFFTTIKVMGSLTGIFNQEIEGGAHRIAKLAGNLARDLSRLENDIFEIQVSAFLHNIGMIGEKNSHEPNLSQVKLGAKIVSLIPNLGKVPTYILHQLEKFDGGGLPDKLSGEKIPLGSRIIAVAAAYDRMLYWGGLKAASPENVYANLSKNSGSFFDPAVLEALSRYINSSKNEQTNIFEQNLSLFELRAGMILSRDVTTKRGEILLTKDMELNDELLEKLWKRQISQQPVSEIFIYKSSRKELKNAA